MNSTKRAQKPRRIPDISFPCTLTTCGFIMLIAQLSRSAGLLKAIEREHVLIFNWLYDTAARRTRLPKGFTRPWQRLSAPMTHFWRTRRCGNMYVMACLL